MKEKRKRFTEKQLVAFGNYLLSDERNEMIEKHPELKDTVEQRKKEVSHADVENWKETFKK
jgi:tRNA A22 N-methylase